MYDFIILVNEFEQKLRPYFLSRTGAPKSWRRPVNPVLYMPALCPFPSTEENADLVAVETHHSL
jgi:hypothetical protein